VPSTGLEGKVVAITGAGRKGGIGRAIAIALAKEGANVAVSDIGRPLEQFEDYQVTERAELEDAANEIRSHGVEAEAIYCDVTKLDEVEALIAGTVERFGRLDVMVNNAGIGLGLVPVVELSEAQWDKNLDVMAKGTFFGIRAAGRQMIAQGGGGRIINIASQAGKTGWPLLGAYCAAKFAILGLTQVAAIELGPHGITVNAICPGTVETPLLDLRGGLWEAYTSAQGVSKEELKKQVLAQIPLRRFQRPEDVADLAVFLASDQGGYITGEAINSTGGQEMH
jgi:NAD(P)-dependent dehydrogenase (short-subunit alcohol dehydrogenase family)